MEDENDPPIKTEGLANLGNTCFVNAVLQVIIHTPPLVDSMLKIHHPIQHGQKGFCVVCCLRKLMLLPFGFRTDTLELVSNLSFFSKTLEWGKQQDAHEFMSLLLNRLGTYLTKSFVSQVTEVICPQCPTAYKTEDFFDLVLNIELADSLEDAVSSYFSPESIEVFCDGCNGVVQKNKTHRLVKLPIIAIMTLTSFKVNSGKVEKSDKNIRFPLKLNLQPFTVEESDSLGENDETHVLYALIEHIGNSVEVGHYVCHLRLSEDLWYTFNDEKVVKISEEEALAKSPYILFYIKKGNEWYADFKRSTNVTPHLDSLKNERELDLSCLPGFFIDAHSYNATVRAFKIRQNLKKEKNIHHVYGQLTEKITMFRKLSTEYASGLSSKRRVREVFNFSSEERCRLLQGVRTMGKAWSGIKKKYFPDSMRSPTAYKDHWRRLVDVSMKDEKDISIAIDVLQIEVKMAETAAAHGRGGDNSDKVSRMKARLSLLRDRLG